MVTLPHDLNAEAGLLGCIIVDPVRSVSCFSKVQECDFYSRQHKIIYRALKNLFDSKTDIDLITLQTELSKNNQLDKVGGSSFLTKLSGIVMTGINIKSYMSTVLDLSKKRHIIATLENVNQMIQDGVEYSEIKDTIIHAVVDHEGQDGSNSQLSDVVSNLVLNYESDHELKRTFPTKYSFLNGITFSSGKMVVIGARPAMGKSAIVTQLALDWAEMGLNVVIFSLEMDEVEVSVRLLSQHSLIDSRKIMNKTIDSDKIDRFMCSADKMTKLPITINDSGLVTIPIAQTALIRYKMEKGNPDIIIFDYLQLMKNIKSVTKLAEVTEISRELKLLAKMFDACVVAVSQLNRSLENRDDKRPRMSDLRESGAIEQDADIVAFIYRDIVYNENADPHSAEFIVRKNRQGEIYTKSCTFLPHCTRFGDI